VNIFSQKSLSLIHQLLKMKNEYNITLSFNQILELVRQLPKAQKLSLARELEKELVSSKLTALLSTFKTDALTLEEITSTVEDVRQARYDARKKS
jgi:hypothetical protein